VITLKVSLYTVSFDDHLMRMRNLKIAGIYIPFSFHALSFDIGLLSLLPFVGLYRQVSFAGHRSPKNMRKRDKTDA